MADSPKDGRGAFLPVKEIVAEKSARSELDKIDPLPPMVIAQRDLSVDYLLLQGLSAIYEIMRRSRLNIRNGCASKEDITNVKDCMVMLHDLRKASIKDAEDLSDEELEKIALGDK